MNKYISLIREMYDNNILLHNPLQIDDSSMPTELIKYGINFDVGCMIDGDWIESLKGNMSEEDRQFQIQSFIKYYDISYTSP